MKLIKALWRAIFARKKRKPQPADWDPPKQGTRPWRPTSDEDIAAAIRINIEAEKRNHERDIDKLINDCL